MRSAPLLTIQLVNGKQTGCILLDLVNGLGTLEPRFGVERLLELPTGLFLLECCSNMVGRLARCIERMLRLLALSQALLGEPTFLIHRPPSGGELPTLVNKSLCRNRNRYYLTSLLRRLITSSASDFFLNVI